MLPALGPQLAVRTPLSTCRLLLKVALPVPTQSADMKVSPEPQAVGQPSLAHEVDVTVRTALTTTGADAGAVAATVSSLGV
jgi:hypothetical protein